MDFRYVCNLFQYRQLSYLTFWT